MWDGTEVSAFKCDIHLKEGGTAKPRKNRSARSVSGPRGKEQYLKRKKRERRRAPTSGDSDPQGGKWSPADQNDKKFRKNHEKNLEKRRQTGGGSNTYQPIGKKQKGTAVP